MNFTSEFFSLFIVMSLSFASIGIAKSIKKIQLPVIVLELVLGMFFGKSFLNLIYESDYLYFLSNIGILVFMFMVGFEINIPMVKAELVRARTINPFSLSILVYILSITTALVLSTLLFEYSFFERLFMAALLSAPAPGIVIPILKEKGLITTVYGQSILLYVILSEVFCLLVISAFRPSTRSSFLHLFLVIPLLIGFTAAIKYLSARQRVQSWFLRTSNFFNMDIRVTTGLLFLCIYMFYWSGFDMILGSFAAGLILSFALPQKSKDVLSGKLDTIGYGFFIPVFFIITGSKLNISLLTGFYETVIFTLILLAVMFISKVVPAFIYSKSFGIRKSLEAGILVSSQFSLFLVGSQIAYTKGLIDEKTYLLFVFSAILSSLLFPTLYHAISEKNSSRL